LLPYLIWTDINIFGDIYEENILEHHHSLQNVAQLCTLINTARNLSNFNNL